MCNRLSSKTIVFTASLEGKTMVSMVQIHWEGRKRTIVTYNKKS